MLKIEAVITNIKTNLSKRVYINKYRLKDANKLYDFYNKHTNYNIDIVKTNV